MSQLGERLEGVVHYCAYHGAAVPCRDYEFSEVHGPGIVHIEYAVAWHHMLRRTSAWEEGQARGREEKI